MHAFGLSGGLSHLELLLSCLETTHLNKEQPLACDMEKDRLRWARRSAAGPRAWRGAAGEPRRTPTPTPHRPLRGVGCWVSGRLPCPCAFLPGTVQPGSASCCSEAGAARAGAGPLTHLHQTCALLKRGSTSSGLSLQMRALLPGAPWSADSRPTSAGTWVSMPPAPAAPHLQVLRLTCTLGGGDTTRKGRD